MITAHLLRKGLLDRGTGPISRTSHPHCRKAGPPVADSRPQRTAIRALPLMGALLLLVLASCARNMKKQAQEVLREEWGEIDGQHVQLFTLRNEKGTTVKVTNYGAIITELHLVDRAGDWGDVVLGFGSLEDYRRENPYFGCIAGRYANRIANGRFEIDGQSYQLATNNGPHHLHGGDKGFDKHVWTARVLQSADGPSLNLTRVSLDGEEGYPGRLETSVTYTLTQDNVLRVDMFATTDAPTLVNLVQHTYWNLAGHDSGNIDTHSIRIHAEEYLPTDATLIPIGGFAHVAGTPFDFQEAQSLGERLQLLSLGSESPAGFDHGFTILGKPGDFRPVCELSESKTGRKLTLWSDQPGCQFYTGNFLDGTLTGKDGVPYRKHQGLCLETQHHPDSIHHPEWPSAILRPGEKYTHRMEMRFGLVKD
jgi:aldose 1-epimerase